MTLAPSIQSAKVNDAEPPVPVSPGQHRLVMARHCPRNGSVDRGCDEPVLGPSSQLDCIVPILDVRRLWSGRMGLRDVRVVRMPT